VTTYRMAIDTVVKCCNAFQISNTHRQQLCDGIHYKKPRVNVEGILTAEEIHEIEHHIGHYPYPRAASLDNHVNGRQIND
jgi:hypothetical protein